jgi:hypothetical protein
LYVTTFQGELAHASTKHPERPDDRAASGNANGAFSACLQILRRHRSASRNIGPIPFFDRQGCVLHYIVRLKLIDRRTKFSYLLLILLVRDFPGDEGYLLLRTRAMVSSHAHPTLNLTLHVIAAF